MEVEAVPTLSAESARFLLDLLYGLRPDPRADDFLAAATAIHTAKAELVAIVADSEPTSAAETPAA